MCPSSISVASTGSAAACGKSISKPPLLHTGTTGAPTRTYDVTLWHFYQALGRDLRTWPLWNAFIDGFDPKLFEHSGIGQEALRQDPQRLGPFFAWIIRTRNERTFSGTTAGEKDVTESKSKVRRRQAATLKQLRKLPQQPDMQAWDRRMIELFPELRDTPTVADMFRAMHSRSG